MKILPVLAVLLLAAFAPPTGHGARRPAAIGGRLHQPLPPLRILRTPQGPKSVRKPD